MSVRAAFCAVCFASAAILAQVPVPATAATVEVKLVQTFSVTGVYDYFCKPHEMAGMVGRIVVGEPGDGPGTKPFGYAPEQHWKAVPEAARKALPSVAEIMKRGTVHARRQ